MRTNVGRWRVTGSLLASVVVVALWAPVASATTTVVDVTTSLNVGPGATTSDVSCSGSSCAAVGTYTSPGGGSQPFVSVQVDGQWDTTSVPAPGGTGVAVQCLSATTCVATGSTESTLGGAWVAVYAGSGWQFSTAGASLPSTGPLTVTSLSCSSATLCVLGGTFPDATGSYQAFVSSFNGTNWSDQEIGQELNSQSDGSVTALSCAPDGSCMAVGYVTTASGATAGFSSQNTGGGWTDGTLGADLSSATVQPTSIYCTAADQCVAGGSYVDAQGNQQAFIGQWLGATWTEQTVASSLSTGNAVVDAVSCADASDCVATGSYLDLSGATQAFASVERSGVWSDSVLAATLNQGGAASGLAVSCLGSSSCEVGGFFTDVAAKVQGFVSEWNGSTWSDHAVFLGQNNGGNASVNAVSCGADNCVAGGRYLDTTTGFHAAVAMDPLLTPTLTLALPPGGIAGTPVPLSVSGAGAAGVSYATTGNGCAIDNNAVTASAPTTCVVVATADPSGLTATSSVSATIIFAAANQSPLVTSPTSAVAGSSVPLVITGGSGVLAPVVTSTSPNCSVVGETVTAATPGACTLTVTNPANGVFAETSTVVTVNFSAQSQKPLTLTGSSASTLATGAIALHVSGGSGSASAQLATHTRGCSLAGSTLRVKSPQFCVVTVTKGASGPYALATTSATFYFVPAPQGQLTVLVSATSLRVGAEESVSVHGGSGGGRVTLSASGNCALHGTVLHALRVGTCSLQATKDATGPYAAVQSSLVRLTVTK